MLSDPSLHLGTSLLAFFLSLLAFPFFKPVRISTCMSTYLLMSRRVYTRIPAACLYTRPHACRLSARMSTRMSMRIRLHTCLCARPGACLHTCLCTPLHVCPGPLCAHAIMGHGILSKLSKHDKMNSRFSDRWQVEADLARVSEELASVCVDTRLLYRPWLCRP